MDMSVLVMQGYNQVDDHGGLPLEMIMVPFISPPDMVRWSYMGMDHMAVSFLNTGTRDVTKVEISNGFL